MLAYESMNLWSFFSQEVNFCVHLKNEWRDWRVQKNMWHTLDLLSNLSLNASEFSWRELSVQKMDIEETLGPKSV